MHLAAAKCWLTTAEIKGSAGSKRCLSERLGTSSNLERSCYEDRLGNLRKVRSTPSQCS